MVSFEFLYLILPALGLTQPLTEMSTRNISLGVRGTVPIVLKSGSLNLLETLGPVQACNGIAFNSSIRNLRTRHAMVTGTHLSWIYSLTQPLFCKYN